MLLCVDPDEAAREATQETLAAAGFETRGCRSLEEADAALAEAGDAVECLVTEYDLPDGTGPDLVARVREVAPDAVCVVFTGAAPGAMQSAPGEAVAEYLSKDRPDAREELAALVRDSLADHSQRAYPLPDDEPTRLESVAAVDAASGDLSEALDRLTELAATAIGVRSAAVGLVDDHHERFLSCHGATFDAMDREQTVCTYAILQSGTMVVEDLREDPRFSDNETLAAAGVRAYAGTPLVTADGHAVGTLCLQHDEPRSFSEADRRMLSLLADEVVDQLELRRGPVEP